MRVPMHQLPLDFSKKILTSKKNRRLTISISDDLESAIEAVSRKLGSNKSETGYRWIIEGLQREIGNVFMSEFHADKKLSDILG